MEAIAPYNIRDSGNPQIEWRKKIENKVGLFRRGGYKGSVMKMGTRNDSDITTPLKHLIKAGKVQVIAEGETPAWLRFVEDDDVHDKREKTTEVFLGATGLRTTAFSSVGSSSKTSEPPSGTTTNIRTANVSASDVTVDEQHFKSPMQKSQSDVLPSLHTRVSMSNFQFNTTDEATRKDDDATQVFTTCSRASRGGAPMKTVATPRSASTIPSADAMKETKRRGTPQEMR